ncbi:hypothetical protein CENSYa_0081 [Cenarchaeum symbiosum A]|uniref:Uncharacterized protein n=1 Tax=Cenarchaeum symbiosum (strain A) TaxID=414004 RepID=A0RTQ9_CENSY|nr:hypothetical protein CENSYa_0081 [Cenarchaeum symbiosum A]
MDRMLEGIEGSTKGLKDGLDPDNLAAWYDAIMGDAREMAPPWLHSKMRIRRDPVLTMKFTVDISKRAVGYFMTAADARMGQMPYSTRLYFLKVLEAMESEVDRWLV